MLSWMDALQHMAKVTGKWHIPKKGTKEYDRVKAYQKKGMEFEDEEPEHIDVTPKKRGRKPKAKAPEAPKEMNTLS